MAKGGDLTLRVRVEGRVQGVGFRAFVSSLAGDYDVNGEVWNTRDGAVEAILQSSSQASLDLMVERLHRGPGRVDRVLVSPDANVEPISDFQITHTR